MTTRVWVPPPVGLHAAATSSSIATWIEDLRQALLDVGLVQTADTGQFSAGTFAWTAPGDLNVRSSEVTYMVFRFGDTLQSTAPIFIRIGILAACGYTANGYSIGSSVEVGSATNGAGAITAGSSGAKTFFIGAANEGPSSTAPDAYQSYAAFSAARGFCGVVFNAGGRNVYGGSYFSNWSPLKFCVERIPDISGAPTTEGYSLWATQQSSGGFWDPYSDDNYRNVATQQVTTVLFGSGAAVIDNSHSIPYVGSVGAVSPDMFCAHGFHLTPEPVRANGILAYPQGRIAHGTEFDLRVYGTSDSHFIAMDRRTAIRACSATTAADFAFLWE